MEGKGKAAEGEGMVLERLKCFCFSWYRTTVLGKRLGSSIWGRQGGRRQQRWAERGTEMVIRKFLEETEQIHCRCAVSKVHHNQFGWGELACAFTMKFGSSITGNIPWLLLHHFTAWHSQDTASCSLPSEALSTCSKVLNVFIVAENRKPLHCEH